MENQQICGRRHTNGECIADRHFPAGIYLPEREISYDDGYNEEILKVLKLDPVHYSGIFKNGKTAKHDDYRYLYDYIMDCTRHMPEDKFKLSFRIFWVLQKWQDFPKCQNPNCNTRLILDNENKAFRLTLDKNGKLVYKWPIYCCQVHAQSDPKLRQNYIHTCIERYGYENVFQVPEYKEKADKSRLASIGVTIPAKSSIILAKMQNTCMERYGSINPYQVEEFKEKSKQTYFNKTGYDRPSQNPNAKAESNARQLAERGYTHIQMRNKAPGYEQNILNNEYDEPLFTLEEFVKADNHIMPMKFRCKCCGKEFEAIHVRFHNRCPNCFPDDWVYHAPSFISSLNRRVYGILDAACIKYEKEFIIKTDTSHRRYDLKLGNILLELNGDYWHANPNEWSDGNPGCKATDVLKMACGNKTASEIWEHDIAKKILAESKGYKVFYLWESEMSRMTDKEILSWIRQKIS